MFYLYSRFSNRIRSEGRITASILFESIKDPNIVFYTIGYEVDDRDTKSLLQDCASSKTNYFNARDADALKNAFEKIGHSLSKLYVTA